MHDVCFSDLWIVGRMGYRLWSGLRQDARRRQGSYLRPFDQVHHLFYSPPDLIVHLAQSDCDCFQRSIFREEIFSSKIKQLNVVLRWDRAGQRQCRGRPFFPEALIGLGFDFIVPIFRPRYFFAQRRPINLVPFTGRHKSGDEDCSGGRILAGKLRKRRKFWRYCQDGFLDGLGLDFGWYGRRRGIDVGGCASTGGTSSAF